MALNGDVMKSIRTFEADGEDEHAVNGLKNGWTSGQSLVNFLVCLSHLVLASVREVGPPVGLLGR